MKLTYLLVLMLGLIVLFPMVDAAYVGDQTLGPASEPETHYIDLDFSPAYGSTYITTEIVSLGAYGYGVFTLEAANNHISLGSVTYDHTVWWENNSVGTQACADNELDKHFYYVDNSYHILEMNYSNAGWLKSEGVLPLVRTIIGPSGFHVGLLMVDQVRNCLLVSYEHPMSYTQYATYDLDTGALIDSDTSNYSSGTASVLISSYGYTVTLSNGSVGIMGFDLSGFSYWPATYAVGSILSALDVGPHAGNTVLSVYSDGDTVQMMNLTNGEVYADFNAGGTVYAFESDENSITVMTINTAYGGFRATVSQYNVTYSEGNYHVDLSWNYVSDAFYPPSSNDIAASLLLDHDGNVIFIVTGSLGPVFLSTNGVFLADYASDLGGPPDLTNYQYDPVNWESSPIVMNVVAGRLVWYDQIEDDGDYQGYVRVVEIVTSAVIPEPEPEPVADEPMDWTWFMLILILLIFSIMAAYNRNVGFSPHVFLAAFSINISIGVWAGILPMFMMIIAILLTVALIFSAMASRNEGGEV